MSAETFEVNVTRWACGRGHFIAAAAVESEDYADPGAYYGVSSRTWATCKVCGEVEEPQLIVVGTQEITVEPIQWPPY